MLLFQLLTLVLINIYCGHLTPMGAEYDGLRVWKYSCNNLICLLPGAKISVFLVLEKRGNNDKRSLMRKLNTIIFIHWGENMEESSPCGFVLLLSHWNCLRSLHLLSAHSEERKLSWRLGLHFFFIDRGQMTLLNLENNYHFHLNFLEKEL